MGGYLKRRAQLLQKIRGGADGLAAPLPMAEVDANLDKLVRVLLGAAHKIQHSRNAAHHHRHIALYMQLAGHHGLHGMPIPFEDFYKIRIWRAERKGGVHLRDGFIIKISLEAFAMP